MESCARVKVYDFSKMPQQSEVDEVRAARVVSHLHLLEVIEQLMERIQEDGGLAEVAEIFPLTAAEARPRWIALQAQLASLLRRSYTEDAPAIYTPLTARAPRKG
jgi:hypothetical protein